MSDSGSHDRQCGNCRLTFPWRPVVVDGVEYCCAGCAVGGPCYCSYDDVALVDLPTNEHPSGRKETDVRSIAKAIPFTPDGQKELRIEIDLLEHFRQEILDECRVAPAHLQEALRRELGAVEEQICLLKETLASGEVIKDTGLVVAVGSAVTVETEYGTPTFMIVGPIATSPKAGCISYESPMGRALLGAELGDRVEVPWNGDHRKLRVIGIKRAQL